MSYSNKIDVLDLLINIIREHEEKMDELVERLEIVNTTIQESPELRARYVPGTLKNNQQKFNSILVVDDDKNLAESFKIVLQSVGFDVDIAATGTQALYRTNRKNYDLILLDINLPDMLGDEVAEKLNDQNEDTKIIMITGYSELKDEMENLNRNVLMKPISPEDLVKITKKTIVKEI
jgi:CheY-like chemotaxis protein